MVKRGIPEAIVNEKIKVRKCVKYKYRVLV